jgi:hypothetical protein
MELRCCFWLDGSDDKEDVHGDSSYYLERRREVGITNFATTDAMKHL